MTFVPIEDEETMSSDRSILDVFIEVFDLLETSLMIDASDHHNPLLVSELGSSGTSTPFYAYDDHASRDDSDIKPVLSKL